jgi:hypothetical protein
MNRPILLTYQVLVGISDTSTGALLIVAPEFTLRLMHLQVPSDALAYVSFVGAFVFSVGLACLYGALLMAHKGCRQRIETVWLLTAFTRASVAIFILSQIMTHSLPLGWSTVALTDGACVVIQAVGLRRRWLDNFDK